MNLQMSLLAVVCHTDKPLNSDSVSFRQCRQCVQSRTPEFEWRTSGFPHVPCTLSLRTVFNTYQNVPVFLNLMFDMFHLLVQHACSTYLSLFIYPMYWAFPERCCWHAGVHIFSLRVQIVPPVANLHYRMFIMFAIPVTMCPSWRAGTKVCEALVRSGCSL